MMSEILDTANLVLGIIGTVTGSLAVIIHIWKFIKENPRLKAEILKCEHDYAVSQSGVTTISFWTDFMIKNIGDRGTSIIDIGLDFEEDRQKYHLKKQFFLSHLTGEKRIWVSPHETLDLKASFYQSLQAKEREVIECHFNIYHTHGVVNIKTVSSKRKREQ